MSYVEVAYSTMKDRPDSFSMLLLKPGFTTEQKDELFDTVHDRKLKLERADSVILPRLATIALYSTSILKLQPDDFIFGLNWKNEAIDYMTSGPSIVVGVSGEDAHLQCREIRDSMRSLHGKVQPRPGELLSDEEFRRRAIRNLIHHPDPEETIPLAWTIDTVLEIGTND